MTTKFHEINALMLEQPFYEALTKLHEKVKNADNKVPVSFRDFLRMLLALGSESFRNGLDRPAPGLITLADGALKPVSQSDIARRLQEIKRAAQQGR
jgi:hypothetical protein